MTITPRTALKAAIAVVLSKSLPEVKFFYSHFLNCEHYDYLLWFIGQLLTESLPKPPQQISLNGPIIITLPVLP